MSQSSPRPTPNSWLASFFTVSTTDNIAMGTGDASTLSPSQNANFATPQRNGTPQIAPTTKSIELSTPPRIDFSPEEAAQIARHARAVAEACLARQPIPVLASPLAETPAYGMFVSFKHGETLRSCKGQFGKIVPLGELINSVTQDSATNDPRFPPVREDELPRLLVEVSLMYNPQTVTAQSTERVKAVRIGQHGLVIAHVKGRGLLLPQVATENRWDANTFLHAVCRKAGLPQDAWKSDDTQLMTFEARLFHSQPQVNSAKRVRPAARAGQFYPADPAEMHASIKRWTCSPEATQVEEAEYRAVMLPHAGWVYCGDVMGRTVARTKIPKTVIIIGPKHTPHGANWSVSNADAWEIPGATVPVATDLRDRLLEMVPAMTCESQAHAQEHAIEVIVPFLLAKNPELQILPIVLGPTAYNQTERLARALAILCQEANEPILLVISSDMNHFAAEPENRRLDFLALDIMCTGDASRLFDTVQQNQISMCGMIPAVTVLRALAALGQPIKPELVHYDNSSTASGQFDRVVGYAGVVIP